MESDDIDQIEPAESRQPTQIKLVPIKHLMKSSLTEDTVGQHDVQPEFDECHTSDMGEINVNPINQNHDRLQSSIDLQTIPSLSKSGNTVQKTKRSRAKFKNETEPKKRISERRKKYREACKSKKLEQLHDSNEISHLPLTSAESVECSQYLTRAALKLRKKSSEKSQNAEILPPDPLELGTEEVIHQESQQELQSSIDLQGIPSLSESGNNAQKKTKRYRAKFNNETERKKRYSERRKKYREAYKSKKLEQLHNSNEISHLPSTSRESVNSSQCLTKAALKSRKYRDNIKAHPNLYRKDYSTERVRAFRTRQLLKKSQNAEILPPDPLELSTEEVIHQESQQHTVGQRAVQAEVHQYHSSDMGEINVNPINQNHDRLQSSTDLQATPTLSKSKKNARKKKDYSTERVRAFRTRQFLKKLENAETLPSHPSESGTGEVSHQESHEDNIIAIDPHTVFHGIFNNDSFLV